MNYSPAFIHLGEVRQSSPPGRMQAPHPLLAWYRWLKELTPHRREGENFKVAEGVEVVGRKRREGRGVDYALHPRSTLQDVSLPFMHDVDLHPAAPPALLPLLLCSQQGLQRLRLSGGLAIQIKSTVTNRSETLIWCVILLHPPGCGR